MYPFPKRGVPRIADGLENDASGDPYSRWCGGVIGAAVPLAIGIAAILSRHAYFVGMRPVRIATYSGDDAITLGVASIAVGLLMHGHYFWTPSHKYYFIAEILKPLSLFLLAAAMGFVVVNQIVFM